MQISAAFWPMVRLRQVLVSAQRFDEMLCMSGKANRQRATAGTAAIFAKTMRD